MLRLTGCTENGEVLIVTAHRLVTWGASERQAYALAQRLTLKGTSTDSEVERAVIETLVAVKQSLDSCEASDGIVEIEYVTGYRKDLQRRLEGRE